MAMTYTYFMNYSNYQKEEMLRLEEPKKLFSILTNLDWEGRTATWADIFMGLNFYFARRECLDEQLSKYLKVSDIDLLIQNFGFDINHIDGLGNNLMLFAATSIDQLGKMAGCPYQFDFCFDHIKKLTKNIYLVNYHNENLLFQYTTYSNKEPLLKLIKEDKGFDLNLANTEGNNLLTNAILNRAPEEVIKLYYDLGLDCKTVGLNKTSVLYFLSFGSIRDIYKEIFENVFSESVNPFSKNKDDEAFLDLLVKDTYSSSYRSSAEWISHTFKLISKGKFNLNNETQEYLKDFFNKNKNVKDIKNYEIAKLSFDKMVLDLELPNKANSQSNKIKI